MTMASVARLAKAKGKDYREREAAGQTTLFGGGASDADSGHRPRRRRPRGPGAEAERNHALRSQHHRKRAEDHQHRRTPGAPGAQEHAQAIMAHNNAADAHNAARTAHAEGRPGAEAAAERANDRTRDAEAASIRARSKETPRHTGRHGEEGGRGSGRIRDALDPGGRAPAPRDPVSDHQIGRRAAHHADAAAAHRAVAAGRPSDAKQHRAAADAHENASVLHAAGHADAGRASVEALAASDAVAGGRGATSSGDDARDRREGEARGRVAQAKAKLDAAKKKAGDKPPSGYYPAKRSKKGGFTDGKGNYWYPGKGAKPAGAHDGEHGKDAALAHHDERRAHHDEMALEHKKAAADPYRTMESRGKHADAERKHHHAAVHHGAAHADIRAGRVEPSEPKSHVTLAGTTSEWADNHDREVWDDEDAAHKVQAEKHRAAAKKWGDERGRGALRQQHEHAADMHDEAHRHGRGSIDTQARDAFSSRATKASEDARQMERRAGPSQRDALDAHTAYKKTKGALGTDLVEYLEQNKYKVPHGAHDLSSLTDKELRKLNGQVRNALNAPGTDPTSYEPEDDYPEDSRDTAVRERYKAQAVRTRRQARKAASALNAEADRRLNEGHKDKPKKRKRDPRYEADSSHDEAMTREAAQMDADGVPHPREGYERKARERASLKSKASGGFKDSAEVDAAFESGDPMGLEANPNAAQNEAASVTYGAHDRPISSVSVPKGHTEIGDHPDFKHGTVTYPNALDPAEAKRLGLMEIPTEARRKEVHDAAVADLSEYAGGHLEMADEDPAYFKQMVGQHIDAANVHMSRDELAPMVEASLRRASATPQDPNAAASASMKQKPSAVAQAARASVSARTEKDTPKPGSHAALVAAGKAALERADHPQHKVPKALLNRGGRLGRERGIKEAAESWYKHPGHSGMPARHEVIKQVQKDRQRWHEDGGGKGSSKVADLAPSYLHEYAKHAASQYGDTPQAAPDPQEHGLSGGEAADLVSRFTKLMGTPEEPTSWSGDHGGAQMPAEHGHGEDFHKRLMTEARTNAASSRSGIHNSAHLHRIVQQADQHVADFAESKSSHRSGGAVATYHPDEEQHWGTAMAALQNAHGDTHRFEAKRRKTDNLMVIRAHRKSGKSTPKA